MELAGQCQMKQGSFLLLFLIFLFLCSRRAGQVQSVHVGLDDVGHDEGGLAQTLLLASHSNDDILGPHLRLLDHDPGAGVVRNAADHLARHPGHVLQHPSRDLHVPGPDVGPALHEDLVVVLLAPGALVGDGVL